MKPEMRPGFARIIRRAGKSGTYLAGESPVVEGVPAPPHQFPRKEDFKVTSVL